MKSDFFKHRILIAIIFVSSIFRFWALDLAPPSLYSDELSQGYNAYSLLKTGMDEHGEFMPVVIKAFGEWKPSLGTYVMIPTIALFGLNEWGVRLPSAIFGTLTVILLYFFVKELVMTFAAHNETSVIRSSQIAFWATLVLAISPWHIFQSRVALHGAITLFFFLLASWSFIKGIKQPTYWYFSSVSYSLLPYSYTGMHMIVGLLSIIIFVFFYKTIQKNLSVFLISMLLFFIIQIPLLFSFLQNSESLLGRAKHISIFYDPGVAIRLWKDITDDGFGIPIPLIQFFHNKLWYFTNVFIKNVMKHIDGNFIFLTGDIERPFQIPSMGIFYLIDFVPLLVGFIFLIKKKIKLYLFLLLLFCILIFPASLTFIVPSAHRAFLSIIPLIIIIAYGLQILWNTLRWRFVIISGYIVSFIFFIFTYFLLIPTSYAQWWDYGEKDLMVFLKDHEEEYQHIVLSENINMPYMALLFYQGVEPEYAHSNLIRNKHKDIAGFEHVTQFGKYEFMKIKSDTSLSEDAVYVFTADEKLPSPIYILQYITNPDGSLAYTVFIKKTW